MNRSSTRSSRLALRLLLAYAAARAFRALAAPAPPTARDLAAAGGGVRLRPCPQRPRPGSDPRRVRRGRAGPQPVAAAVRPPAPPRRRRHRLALALATAALFFAGAAFTAVAGDRAAVLLDPGAAGPVEGSAPGTAPIETVAAPATVPAETVPAGPVTGTDPGTGPEEAAAVEETPAPPARPGPGPTDEGQVLAGDPAAAPVEAVAAAETPVEAVAAAETPVSAGPAAAPAKEPPAAGLAAPALAPRARPQPAPAPRWVVRRAAEAPAPAPDLRAEGTAPVVWLNRALPDPTPPARRLDPAFARALATESARAGADWALVLGVLRAQGERGAVPAARRELRVLARRLAGARDGWSAVLALAGRTSFADRAVALARYHRAVGLDALVTGLEAAKPRLVRRLLADPRATIYRGGRADLAAGRVEVRVVVLAGYLAETFGSVTVSSLVSGHRPLARPGVLSAHVFGDAVDVSSVGATPVAGNQQPGGATERAVRAILLLPAELQPRQVISLLGLGGPSFPLADHADHVHVGY